MPSALPTLHVVCEQQGRVLGDALVTRSPRQEAKRKPVRQQHDAFLFSTELLGTVCPSFDDILENVTLEQAIGMRCAISRKDGSSSSLFIFSKFLSRAAARGC